VIGGGQVALRKATSILECGAKVTVVSPLILPELKKLTRRKKITLIQRNYRLEDIKEAKMVFAATDSKETNRKNFGQGEKAKGSG